MIPVDDERLLGLRQLKWQITQRNRLIMTSEVDYGFYALVIQPRIVDGQTKYWDVMYSVTRPTEERALAALEWLISQIYEQEDQREKAPTYSIVRTSTGDVSLVSSRSDTVQQFPGEGDPGLDGDV